MAWETIERTDHDEGIVRISLDRPETHNAQSPQLLDELDDAVRQVESEEDSRVLILDGNGPSFSSGHDLGPDDEGEEWSVERRLAFEEKYYHDYCMTIRDLTLPTIAQVHGYCGAGGMMLTSVCDLVVAAETAQFANPVNRMAAAGLELLLEPWEVGFRKGKELLWTGEQISGADGERLGMVNHAVPEDELFERTMVLAKKVARMPPFGIQLSKRSFNFMRDEMGYDASHRYHLMVHQLAHASEEWDEWHEEANAVAREEGLGGWLEFRDEPFDVDPGADD
jgi:enoyl-CoA hydratase